MKNKNLFWLLSVAFWLTSYSVGAQSVGIGTNTPDSSAILDIMAPAYDKGLLIPRVSLQSIFDEETIKKPANSLLVYNTNNVGMLEGFYYNSGNDMVANWQRLSTANDVNSNWSLAGNNIADLAFIGSKNDEDVVFKRFNEEAFRIAPGGSLLSTGNTTAGKVPTSGPGTKLFWSPAKAAFRAGKITNLYSTYWNEDSVGKYSFAVGQDTKAKGDYSAAIGNNARASGQAAIAMGNSNANGNYSVAMGAANTSTGDYSLSMGYNNHAEGNKSVAIGEQAYSKGVYSVALGYDAKALATYSVAIGGHVSAQATYSSMALGNYTIASGDYSTAMGDHTIASGLRSTSMGYETSAEGAYSTAIGVNTTTVGKSAVSMGSNTTAKGDRSTAMGHYTTANAYASTTIGLYNDNGDVNVNGAVSSSTNRLFQIGNGDGDNARKNALTVLKNGNIGTGGVTNPSAQLHMRSGLNNSWSSFIRMENTSTNQSGYVMYDGEALNFRNTDSQNGEINFYISSPDNYEFSIRSGSIHITNSAYIDGNLVVSGAIINPSDIRLKRNVQPLKEVLKKLSAIQPITYYFKDKKVYPASHQIGFSAQEIEKEFPQLVNKTDNGYLAVNYPQMTAVAIQAIKEQQVEIQELKNKNTQLEGIINQLNERIEKLEFYEKK